MQLARQGCLILTVLGLISTAWMPLTHAQTVDSSVASTPAESTTHRAPTGANLPDSPGATLAKLMPPSIFALPVPSPQDQNASTSNPTTAAEPQAQQPSQPAPQSSQKPVGTAAAEPTNVNGIAASQPAGVAIAPGKQHRVRTIVIATGAIIAAGIAVGLVAALTAGTSSRPPGAH
jgi:hypothetical protein